MSRLSGAPLSTLAAEGAGPFLEQMPAEDLTEQLRDPFAVSRLPEALQASGCWRSFHQGEIPPKVLQTLRASEERGEIR